ncbi:hypothetical protein QIT55_gp34 [Nitrosopumilus spindle-shaped virus]|uniref:Adenine methyltransferase n=1 Tax=Nitrosopumilus spindle-shaped virus 1 TaxID=2848002 RepID=A0A514K307_9VIRU|nr:hypothetical protein QIT55_gp34 [Nitrosopumilus spindle-shaped virus]QDI74020.1 hypothetical protein [Nitrosopumilus spindle-shaped virus]
MKQLAYMPKSKKQEHLTPDLIFDLIKEHWNISKEEFYDPCPPGTPFRAPIFFNGLYGDWKNLNYVNSPFEKEILQAFVKKAVEQFIENGFRSVLLCPTKTDQDWFHDFILANNFEILWIRKRLKFKGNKHHATDTHFLVMIE